MGQAVSKKVVEYLTYEEFEKQLVLGVNSTTNFFRGIPVYPSSDGNGYIIAQLLDYIYFGREAIILLDKGVSSIKVITKEQLNEDYTPVGDSNVL